MPNTDNRRPTICIIESPYAGTNPVHYRRNIAYLHAAIQDCLVRGEVPYASHGLFPGALDDTKPEQRKQGIEAGFKTAEALMASGAFRGIYNDRGISTGMNDGIAHADRIGMLYVPRSLGPEWAIENDPTYCEHREATEVNGLLLCTGCGVEFFDARLPREALHVAQTWLNKRA